MTLGVRLRNSCPGAEPTPLVPAPQGARKLWQPPKREGGFADRGGTLC